MHLVLIWKGLQLPVDGIYRLSLNSDAWASLFMTVLLRFKTGNKTQVCETAKAVPGCYVWISLYILESPRAHVDVDVDKEEP